jgi:hypothetical protein
MAAEQVDKVKMLTDRISPILIGCKTILLRGRLFHEHMKIVRDLTKLNAMRIKLEDFQGAGE